MMSTLTEEPFRGEPRCGWSQPSALILRRQKDVEAHVAVVGIGLLVVPKPPRQRTVDFDRKRGAVVDKTLARMLRIIERPPPLPYAGARQNGRELVNLAVTSGDRRYGLWQNWCVPLIGLGYCA
jgi:hypothetical protein